MSNTFYKNGKIFTQNQFVIKKSLDLSCYLIIILK